MARDQATSESDEDLAEVVTGHGPCTYLLLSLLALILVYPYLKGDIVSRTILGFYTPGCFSAAPMPSTAADARSSGGLGWLSWASRCNGRGF